MAVRKTYVSGRYASKDRPKDPPTIILRQPAGAKRKVSLCGTPAGYERHGRNGEWADDRCKAAHAKRVADRRGTKVTGRRNSGGRCGTWLGYRKHIYNKERPCWPCAEAANIHQKKYKVASVARTNILKAESEGKKWHLAMLKNMDPTTGMAVPAPTLATMETIVGGIERLKSSGSTSPRTPSSSKQVAPMDASSRLRAGLD